MGAVRARHVKSRRGCKTCRVRHLRCDETYPQCQNCSLTGRRCEGVSNTTFTFVTPPSHSHSTSSVQRQLSLSSYHRDGQRSLQLYAVKVAPLFQSGSLDAAFWSTLVPQLSRDHPAVTDCIVSITLLYEYPIDPKRHSNDELNHNLNPHQLRALKCYSRAVTRVAHQYDLGADNEVTALVTCVLFIALEFQQGNMHQALLLVRKGIELLFTYLQSPSKGKHSPDSRAIAEVLIPFYSRHAIFMSTLNLPLLSCWASVSQLSSSTCVDQTSLHTVSRLLDRLHALIYETHHMIRSANLILHDTAELERMHMSSRQQSLLTSLQTWQKQFTSLDLHLHPSHELISAEILPSFLVAHTWASCSLSRSQSTFDAYASAFEQIVYHSTRIIMANNNDSTTAAAVPDSTTTSIPPLYFTATKCRDPTIRRSALDILRHAPKHCSIWGRIPTCGILEAIIAFEEDTTRFRTVPTSMSPPPEHRRVHDVQLLATGDAIRLFTYAQGHPSEPGFLQMHVVDVR